MPSPYTEFWVRPLKVVSAMRRGVSFGLSTTSKCSFLLPTGVATERSSGLIDGGAPSLPAAAVRWSPVIVPIGPPTLTILVEANDEESVVTTRLRAIGSATSPRLRNGCPQRDTRSGCNWVRGQEGVLEG